MADDKYSMSKADEQILRKNGVFLVKNLLIGEILIKHLEEEKVLTSHAKQKLKSKPTDQEKASYLLDVLPTRGPTAFKAFIYGLMVSEDEPIARKLSEKLADQYMKENPSSKAVQESIPGGESSQLAPSSGSMEAEVAYSKSYYAQPSSDDKNCDGPNLESKTVSKINPNDPRIRDLLTDPKVYRMSRKKRGRAWIVCMTINRCGTTTDTIKLHNLFESLHFDVKFTENPTREELLEHIIEETEDEYHKDTDAFIMFILAHGAYNTIKCSDNLEISIDKSIVQSFYADSCRYLAGKPKMFFIQACQGDNISGGVSIQSDASTGLPLPMGNLSLSDTDKVHPMEDVIIEYATVPGYKAYRDPEKGSWFIDSLVDVFTTRAHIDHLCDMLKEVRQRVKDKGMEYQKERVNTYTAQLTRTDDRTTKHLYFFPGYIAID